MIPDYIAYILPFIVGVFLTLQGGSSGQLVKYGRGFAGSVTILVEIVMGIVLYLALSDGGRANDLEKGRLEAPWYSHLGGVMGSFYILSMTALIRPLGFATFFLVAVLFQLCSAMVFDSFGIVGLSQRNATVGRGLGIVVVFLGVVLVNAPWLPFVPSWVYVVRDHNDGERSGDVALKEVVEIQSGLTAVVAEDVRKMKVHEVSSNLTLTEKTETSVNNESVTSSVQSGSIMPIAVSPNSPSLQPSKPSSHGTLKLDCRLIFPALAGVCLSLQAGMNGTMGQTSFGPWFTTLYSILIAAIPMFILFAYEYYHQPISFKEHYHGGPTSPVHLVSYSYW
ncbi:hypothetical protein HDU76_001116 [Blyttiomyces sp. JEL0837]|nr:hypothetical protein HDU76_001116 [Blyttiomyces sp. JEL0837]